MVFPRFLTEGMSMSNLMLNQSEAILIVLTLSAGACLFWGILYGMYRVLTRRGYNRIMGLAQGVLGATGMIMTIEMRDVGMLNDVKYDALVLIEIVFLFSASLNLCYPFFLESSDRLLYPKLKHRGLHTSSRSFFEGSRILLMVAAGMTFFVPDIMAYLTSNGMQSNILNLFAECMTFLMMVAFASLLLSFMIGNCAALTMYLVETPTFVVASEHQV